MLERWLIRAAGPKLRLKVFFGNICWVMIDSQDQHNHNEIPSITYLIDLNSTVKRFLPGQCSFKTDGITPFWQGPSETSRAIKQVKVCIHYNSLLGLFLSPQGPIDYLSNDGRGGTVHVWRSSNLRALVRWSTDFSWKLKVQNDYNTRIRSFQMASDKILKGDYIMFVFGLIGRCIKTNKNHSTGLKDYRLDAKILKLKAVSQNWNQSYEVPSHSKPKRITEESGQVWKTFTSVA